MSVDKVIAKAKRFAGHILEALPDDIEYEGGRAYVKGHPDTGLTLPEIAAAAWNAVNLPPDTEPGLEFTSYFEPTNFTFPFGTHVALVEVDAETGKVDLQRYVAIDDCGTVINPMLLEGQLHGGIAQGVAQALMEEAVYSDDGQLITGSLMDYNIPKADQLPKFELGRTVTTTNVNPMGAKGIGEAGTIGSTPAVVNAVVDALSPFGVEHIDMLLRPENSGASCEEVRNDPGLIQLHGPDIPGGRPGSPRPNGRRIQAPGRRSQPGPADEVASGPAFLAHRSRPRAGAKGFRSGTATC
jgi:carbon-monoxide dehydrogenase large subunit